MDNNIPQWVIDYNNAGHQSSAGRAINILMSELTRLRSELQQEREKVQFLLDELIYESRSEPGTYFMWGRSGGSRVPEKIMEIQKSKAK